MDAIEYFILRSYFGALLWITTGIWIIHFIIKNPAEDKLSQGGDMKGWAGGLFCIAGGVIIIVLKLLGKL